MSRTRARPPGWASALLAVCIALGLVFGVSKSSALGPAGSYSNVVFADGFESGTLGSWDGLLGNGSAAAIAAAAHSGSYGLRLANASGQFQVLGKALQAPLVDSSSSFWVRLGSGSGLQMVAQARDASSGVHMWELAYDWSRHGFYLWPFQASGSAEIWTGTDSAPAGTWIQVEVQYTATATGGARIYLNGLTQAGWQATGDYTRSANFQRLQLWNDAVGTTDFDDVTIAAPSGAATVPGAPTGVAGTAGDGSVALSWTAPASNGGSAITGYVVTPYVAGVAQTPIPTGSTATSRLVTGLTNATAYTFTIAAVNAAGTGAESAASAPVTPAAAATAPGAPSGVTGWPGDASVALSWTAPASNGGSPITDYRVTPYIGATAQTPIATGSAATSFTVNGLTNGTAYTFRVAATNGVGTGADSAASAAVTPSPGYTSVVFADGFESGSLSAWDGLLANGSATVVAPAAHTGGYGLRVTNTAGQLQVAVKTLSVPLADSSSTFWVRLGSGSGLQNVAQARDGTSSVRMWDLAYDWSRHGFYLFPYSAAGSGELFTGTDTAPANTWVKVEVQYTATATGGAKLFLNGATQPGWGVTGNYTRSANLQRLQLWNDVVGTTDFDDVSVATRPGAGVPGAPTNVTGSAGNASVALSWTAPSSNGGSAITGYRITPYVGGTAQTPIATGSTATSYTVAGLTNGTAYTFSVAGTNANGTGTDSSASAPLTPQAAATVPGAPTALSGWPGDASVSLTWTAPASTGGSPITSYRITPYVGTTAQAPISTGSSATTFTVTGLTNGTAYTFTVAATNAVGTGAASAASPSLRPRPGYTNVVFGDGFESGSLANWNGAPGTGTTSVLPAAARNGAQGLRLTNASGQYSYLVKALTSALVDSSTSFWVRPGSGSGVETIAQARDSSSTTQMWELDYDWNRHGFVLLAYGATGSTELFTGSGSAAAGTWVKVEVTYTATSGGGVQLYLNGQTQADWGASGNYTRSANLQRVQLWNDAVGTTDFDDARVSTPPPAGSTLPGAPTAPAGVSRDSGAALTWTAPASDGGSAISGYRVTPYIGGVAQAPVLTDYPVTSFTVGGLTNGTTYTFTVAAINGVGTGPASAASAAVTPGAATLPGAPTAVTGAPRDGAVALSWTAPASDGGTAITGYWITPSVGGTAQTPVATGSATTSFNVSGLTNGTAYTFSVAAANAVGTGAASAPSAPISPHAALSEYTSVVFADGFESGTLGNWNGAQGTGSSAVVAGAARTGAYGLRVSTLETQYEYVNKLLAAPLVDSAITVWVNPGSNAGVTTIAQARDGSSSLNMWELAYDGTRHGFLFYPYGHSGSSEIFTGVGSATAGFWVKVVVQYTATSPGGAQLYLNGQTQADWGVSGDFTRTANLQRLQLWQEGRNATDFDDVSVATLPPPGATVPGAPTGVTGSPLDRAVALTWTAPASDGGSAITGYRITPYVGTVAQAPVQTGSTSTSFTVAGLTNGTSYTFTLAAVNAAGTGPDSTASAPVTPVPAPPPGPPTSLTATAGDASVALAWTAPASDGGSPITGYRVTPYVGGTAQTSIATGSTATSYTVTGLTNGTAYTFTVAAINGSGPSAESTPSGSVTPAPPTAPGAPTAVSGAPRNGAVALTWVAPASNGGSTITSYRITPYVGANARTPISTGSTATGYTVTGLTNGTAYTFTVAATNAVGTGAPSAASAPVTPAVPPANPIVLENQQQGTTSYQFTIDKKAEHHEIEGYASATSVNKGSSIDLKVSLSSSAQYTMDIYRMGWYPQGTNPDGSSCAPSCGGRLMLHVGPLAGSTQPTCPTVVTPNDPNFGMTECQWTTSYTLNVPTSWTTGSYLVKLKRLDGVQLENYMTFVVRDDASTAPVVYSLDVTTWQAYNFWGGAGNNNVGYDLYARFNDITGDNTGSGRAYTVSFDRPYSDQGSTDGAGDFMNWDFPLVRWMESKGYDMTYVTSTDLESRQNLLSGHRVFVNTGHDEYYSDGMRTTIQNGIAGGVDMAFFSANNFYFRTIWSANGSGTSLRRIHSDKNALPGSTTYEYRLLSPPFPENIIGGVMVLGTANDRPYLVKDASSWIYAGTGLSNYTGNGTNGVITSGPGQNALPGIIGYEFDARATTTSSLSSYASFEPPGTQTVGHSFVPAADGNATNVWHDAVLYTAPSGATVFSAGTIQWPWGLDDGYNSGFCSCGHNYVNAATQKITANILDRLSAP